MAEKLIEVEVIRAIGVERSDKELFPDNVEMIFPNKPTGEKDKDGKLMKPEPVFIEIPVSAAKKLQDAGAVKAVIKE